MIFAVLEILLLVVPGVTTAIAVFRRTHDPEGKVTTFGRRLMYVGIGCLMLSLVLKVRDIRNSVAAEAEARGRILDIYRLVPVWLQVNGTGVLRDLARERLHVDEAKAFLNLTATYSDDAPGNR